MLASDIPDFFVELGQIISSENTTYNIWYEKNSEKLKEIAKKRL